MLYFYETCEKQRNLRVTQKGSCNLYEAHWELFASRGAVIRMRHYWRGGEIWELLSRRDAETYWRHDVRATLQKGSLTYLRHVRTRESQRSQKNYALEGIVVCASLSMSGANSLLWIGPPPRSWFAVLILCLDARLWLICVRSRLPQSHPLHTFLCSSPWRKGSYCFYERGLVQRVVYPLRVQRHE